MPIAATIKYFGSAPTTIELKSSDNFNGTAHTGVPVITPGKYTFAPQAGGGLFAFHEEVVRIQNITYRGGGTLTIKKTTPAGDALIATITAQGEFSQDTLLSPGDSIKFESVGATNPSVEVTSQTATTVWTG